MNTTPAAPPPPDRPRLRAGLLVRLVALAAAVSLPPLALLAFVLVDINARALRNDARELHLALAADVRRALRAELARSGDELAAVGLLLIGPGVGDDRERLALVGSRLGASGTFDHVTLYAPDGARGPTVKVKEAPLPALPERLPAELLRAAASNASGLVGLAAGEVVPAERGPALELVRELRVDGQPRGFIAGRLPLAGLARLLGELGETRLGDPSAIYVLAEGRRLVLAADLARVERAERVPEGGILAALDPGTTFRHPFGLSPEYDAGGEARVGALETVPELGWAVVVERPRSVAYASLASMRRSVAVGLAGAALLAVVGALLAARRLTRPIRALVSATREIGERRYGPVPALVSGRGDELGELGRAMDDMSDALARSEARLVTETRVRGALSRYLAPDVVERAVREPEALKLGGERREVTVLFADVVGFTRLTELLPPEAVVAILNDLFTFATEIVERRGGMVDKFIGDCVMAVWGSPAAAPDDALRAVLAAADLRRWLETANRRWRQRYAVEVHLAMGLHSGEAVAGNLGSERRMDYTVIGSVVNQAARLEALAASGQILVSPATRERAARAAAQAGPRLELSACAAPAGAGFTEVFEVPA
ncbi:MAG: adenylate/guanylate cyclase domain-containing protein [Anaeromyxobacter sp.]